MMSRPEVFALIDKERTRQIAEKGYTPEHDDGHCFRDWLGFILHEVECGKWPTGEVAPVDIRRRVLVKIAAVCVAALETML